MIWLLPLFLLGQLVRIPLGDVVITPLDLGVILLDLVLLVRIKTWLKAFVRLPWFMAYAVFLSVVAASLVIAFLRGESVSLFALGQFVRILLYQGVLIGAIQFGRSSLWLSRALLTFSLLGFAQLFFFPDLGFLVEWGWDPHYGRLVSTMLDPNFASFLASVGVLIMLVRRNMRGAVFCMVAVLLAFSRSGTIGLAAGLLSACFFFRRRQLVTFFAVFLVLSGFFFFFRSNLERERNIDRQASLQGREVTVNRALELGKRNLIFGVGFNRFRDASLDQGLLDEKDVIVHSTGSADNSLLFLWATTGVVGIAAFGWIVWSLVYWLWGQGEEARWWIVGAIGWMTHAQAVNSLFFVPIVFVMLWWLGGVVSGREGNRADNRDAVARKV
ncbi:MAG: O-antigen ligase family protein [bacterium]|nr:O-antigen ligase family protein [bacterium]